MGCILWQGFAVMHHLVGVPPFVSCGSRPLGDRWRARQRMGEVHGLGSEYCKEDTNIHNQWTTPLWEKQAIESTTSARHISANNRLCGSCNKALPTLPVLTPRLPPPNTGYSLKNNCRGRRFGRASKESQSNCSSSISYTKVTRACTSTVTSEAVRARWYDYEYETHIHLCGSA